MNLNNKPETIKKLIFFINILSLNLVNDLNSLAEIKILYNLEYFFTDICLTQTKL